MGGRVVGEEAKDRIKLRWKIRELCELVGLHRLHRTALMATAPTAKADDGILPPSVDDWMRETGEQRHSSFSHRPIVNLWILLSLLCSLQDIIILI